MQFYWHDEWYSAVNKNKHYMDFIMPNGVYAEAYIFPYLFISENTVHVQGAGENCSGQSR